MDIVYDNLPNLFPKGYTTAHINNNTIYLGDVASELKGDTSIYHSTMYIFKDKPNYYWDGKIRLQMKNGVMTYSTYCGIPIEVYEDDDLEYEENMIKIKKYRWDFANIMVDNIPRKYKEDLLYEILNSMSIEEKKLVYNQLKNEKNEAESTSNEN
jgi:hypothetical protein